MFRTIPLILLFIPMIVTAEDQPKPGGLSEKEIREGWLALFDGETTFGWKADGEVKIDKGSLVLEGDKPATVTTSMPFSSCELQFHHANVRNASLSILGKKIEIPAREGSMTVRASSTESGDKYSVDFRDANGKSLGGMGGGSGSGGSGDGAKLKPKWLPISFTTAAGGSVALRNIKLQPDGAKPIFNGKDLAGWKVLDDPKRNQSKWSVTKEGWLNVKNGPGDLQTESAYDDFLLQLECISNGKALNSGIFFRCLANQYQQGYEAQVQNAFKDNDRTKPADFGTGAIYRRIAARKVVPNDQEWFTMTVMAHGRHMVTWVNGYQTVDWTDERKEDENPRQGYRAGKGHLSIQGHDPTTDLSFRNLRILELPR